MSSRSSDVEKVSTTSKDKDQHGLDISTDARFVREDEEGVEQAYLVKSELGMFAQPPRSPMLESSPHLTSAYLISERLFTEGVRRKSIYSTNIHLPFRAL
jgi:hypothetical protein